MNLSVSDWANIVLVVTGLLQLVKPLLETIPGMRPNDGQHDTLLRLVAFLFSLGAVLYLAATRGGLDMQNAGMYLFYTLQQFLSSQGAYGFVKLSGTALSNAGKAFAQSAQQTPPVQVQTAFLAPASATEATHLTDGVPVEVLSQYTAPVLATNTSA